MITKIVRQNALYFKPFVLISKAKMIPKETSCGCENSPNQGPAKYWKNVEAISPVITLPRFANPTQVKRFSVADGYGRSW